MRYPNFLEEKKLWKKGFKIVAGLDEAGRGPLAGPVVAGVVVIKQKPKKLRKSDLLLIKELSSFGVRDSKKLTSKKREELYKILTSSNLIYWATGRVSEKKIDQINILEATKLAMLKAIEKLKRKNPRLKISFLVIDGRMSLNVNIPQKSIVRGDDKVFSVAAASILAKVTRDKIMEKYNKIYPNYGFSENKGYGTAFHFKMIKKHGSCKIHRNSFRPMRIDLKLKKPKRIKSKS